MDIWKIREKVVAIVTDNAPNIVNAVEKQPKIRHIPCFAHTLNLVVQKAIDESQQLEKIREKVREAVAYFHRVSRQCWPWINNCQQQQITTTERRS